MKHTHKLTMVMDDDNPVDVEKVSRILVYDILGFLIKKNSLKRVKIVELEEYIKNKNSFAISMNRDKGYFDFIYEKNDR